MRRFKIARGSHRSPRSQLRANPSPSSSVSRSGSHERHQSSLFEQEVNLVTNAYGLNSTNPSSTIHEYSLILVTTISGKTASDQVLRRNFVMRSIRKLLMDELLPKLIDTRSSKGSVVIEHNLEAIYSSKVLTRDLRPMGPSKKTNLLSEEFSFKNLSVKTDLLSCMCVDVIIKYSRSFTLESSNMNYTVLTSILHHQLLLDMWRYGAVYYSPHDDSDRGVLQENRLDLISKHVMGISLSGLRRTTSDETLVVIHCSHSYITRSYSLIDLLATFINGKPMLGIRPSYPVNDQRVKVQLMPEIEKISGGEQFFQSFCAMLNGFKCRAEILAENINLRFSLTKESAAELFIESKGSKNQISVHEHFKRLGISLHYPNLPCLKSSSVKLPYCPLELCSLIPGQKVPIFRLSSAARNHLAVLNKPRPEKSKQMFNEARDVVVSISKAECETFGICLNQNPLEAKGSVLHRPALQFKKSSYKPDRDFWESGVFYQAMGLSGNWCVVNTVTIDFKLEDDFFQDFSQYCTRFGFVVGRPCYLDRPKMGITSAASIASIIEECHRIVEGDLKFVMFIIDSTSTPLNRLIHLSFDEHPSVTATCLRIESVLNYRQRRSIFRTLVHKLNARLGGTNVTYQSHTLDKLSLKCNELMVMGLDVTHPDNELTGVSIVGCAYTYSRDLFKHRSLVWPQSARVEIIGKMDSLMERILHEYFVENGRLPKQIIIYRDGVSHEEFEKVKTTEISKTQSVLAKTATETGLPKPNLSYIIAQKRHTIRFHQIRPNGTVTNPPSGTLVEKDIVPLNGREFYLYSNTSPQATARPLHYHVLLNELGMENLQKLTYFLCFNFGKCSSTLSMPSSLRYAHNAAYDARNRVIASREFKENMFYTSKFFC